MTERQSERGVRFYDLEPPPGRFREEVLAGLLRPDKQLSSKLFYDERGSQLFEQISELADYYATRTELAIMNASIEEITGLLGPECLLIEFGSGSSKKTRLLLDHLQQPAAYIPVDISRQALLSTAQALADEYANLELLPVCADYTGNVALPRPAGRVRRRVVYFPGSTIGNFHPHEAQSFLQRIAAMCGSGGGLLIGVDLKKDPLILHRAYNDQSGVTAAFNLNLLARINRELDAGFQLDQFKHYAFYNPVRGRIEMHLISLAQQQVNVAGQPVQFTVGESIWTESSYKYNVNEFAQLAAGVGFDLVRAWTDDQRLFSVQYYQVR